MPGLLMTVQSGKDPGVLCRVSRIPIRDLSEALRIPLNESRFGNRETQNPGINT